MNELKYENITIQKVNVFKKEKRIEVLANSPVFMHYNSITVLCRNISEKLGFENVDLKLTCGEEICGFADILWDSVICYLNEKNKSLWSLVTGSTCEYENGILHVKLLYAGAGILETRKAGRIIADYISKTYGIQVKVEFVDGESKREEKEECVIKLSDYIKPESQRQVSIDTGVVHGANAGGRTQRYGKRKKLTPEDGLLQKTRDGLEIIMGKEIQDMPIPMDQVTLESGMVTVNGKIFSVEDRTIKDGTSLFTFEFTDLTNSLTGKFFLDTSDLPFMMNKLKPEKWLTVQGNIQYDKFMQEMVLMVKSIQEFRPQKRQDTAQVKRVELHLHTQMSMMDAITPPGELVKRAIEWGHDAIAITDHGVVQAYPDAYTAAKGKNIKIIYGVECYITKEKEKSKFEVSKTFPYYHAIILVKNEIGKKNLYKLISESHLNHFYKKPRIPRYLLDKYREGLLLGSACEAGELYRAFTNGTSDEEIEEIANYYDYYEIQPTGNNMFMVYNGTFDSPTEIENINKKILELGDRHNKLVVATCDVHFMDPADEVYRRILMSGQGYSDADRQAPLYFRTTDEMLDEFKYLGSRAYEVVVENTRKIADMIEVIKPVPEGTFPPVIEGAESEIKEMSLKKAHEIYGDILPDVVNERLEKELNSIIKNGFSVMYVIARKLVQKSNEDGYLVGSRGSVGSSFVANMSGITEVNSLPAHYRCESCKYTEFHENEGYDCGFDLPDKDCPVCGKKLIKDGYDIPFETFLGFEGDKEPDIDLNFSGEYQSSAHKYTEELFGEGHVFRAGTISTLAEKTAIGFVKKYLESKEKLVLRAELNRLAQGCTGIKKTTGQHPGGVMIIPHDMEIYDFTPIQRPADDSGSDVITTHFDYHFLHGSILKLDILGHDAPTIIKMLEDFTHVSAQDVQMGDETVMSLFSGTEVLGITPEDVGGIRFGTLGIPEFGTEFVRQMLSETKPTKFSELIRISGLSHGTGVWVNNAQTLIQEGECTLSESICCRDDIMLYLIHKNMEKKASFKIMEQVRKGKGLTEEQEADMREHGVPEWYIKSCKTIEYMFPKAHAAAYVMMSFRIAWYKINYPMEFYCTFFTIKVDDFDAMSMIYGSDRAKTRLELLTDPRQQHTAKEDDQARVFELVVEMYARGLKFLPVDIYKSEARRFLPTGNGVLPPLASLQGLGIAAAENIIKARADGEFVSIEDLKINAKLNKSVIEILRNAGCLGGLSETNQLTLF
ncbi:MAG: PolC-type DNA polymerase III [Clostridiales bacterium]|jgi:DNA polymerase-3 subunit alpha (Gram-positive type)|nr:PolC-type DNA polymerase III [Clostridiales bacterium]